MRNTAPWIWLLAACLPLVACDGDDEFDPGELDLSHSAPPVAGAAEAVTPYSGDSDIVLEAQATLHNGFALHANVIVRTCGPTNGVCHNQKEYPDLHTPANFIEAVGAPCNVQPLSHEAVFDRCELPGDRFKLRDDVPELEVAYVEYVAGEGPGDDASPTAETPGLHIYLAGTLSLDGDSFYETGSFIRTFVNEAGQVEDLPFARYRSRYWLVTGEDGYTFDDDSPGTHLLAEVGDYQSSQIEALLAVGLQQGDMNRNGTLGARQSGNPIALLEPGLPEESYIIGRLRGTLGGEEVPGTRMPLANQPLSNAEMLAFFCFVEGLQYMDGAAISLEAPIDYGRCSYSDNPETLELLGSGVTWSGRIQRILEFNCGGCHGGGSPSQMLDLLDGDVHARLMEPSSQRPELKLIEPGLPEQSYLYLKITADPSIEGLPMPVNPLTGMGGLKQQEIADLRTWIEEGALREAVEVVEDADAGM